MNRDLFHPSDRSASSRIPRIPRITVLLLAILLTGSAAFAQWGETHPVLLMPGADEVALSLSGWVVPHGETFTATVIEPPRYGTWNGDSGVETYRPGALFWELGGDRIVLSIASASGVSHHTLVLAAADPVRRFEASEDFETSGGVLPTGPNGWFSEGDTSHLGVTTDSLDGTYSLEIHLQGQGAALARTSGPDHGTTGVDAVGHKSLVNPDLPTFGDPDDPQPLPGSGGPFSLVRLGDLASVQMRYSGVVEVRATVSNLLVGSCQVGGCATDWRPLPIGEDSIVALWISRDTPRHRNDGATLHFVVDSGVRGAFHDKLTHLAGVPADTVVWSVGARGDALPGGRVRMDLLGGWTHRVLDGSPPDVVAEDFSNGWGATWKPTGAVRAASTMRSGSGSSQWTFEVDLLATQEARDKRSVLVDEGPWSSRNLRAEMLLDLRHANLTDGSSLTLWGASEDVEPGLPGATQPVELQLAQFGGTSYLRARVLDDSRNLHVTNWLPVSTTEPVPVVLHWWAKQVYGLRDGGGVRLSVDGTRVEKTGVENGDRYVESHAFGAWRMQVGEPTPARISVVRVDDVLVHY